MKTVTYPVCERCNAPIQGPAGGVIIQGNIYVATITEERGGIVGNAFPEPSEDGTIMTSEIQEYCFCNKCLKEVLGL